MTARAVVAGRVNIIRMDWTDLFLDKRKCDVGETSQNKYAGDKAPAPAIKGQSDNCSHIRASPICYSLIGSTFRLNVAAYR